MREDTGHTTLDEHVYLNLRGIFSPFERIYVRKLIFENTDGMLGHYLHNNCPEIKVCLKKMRQFAAASSEHFVLRKF